MSEFSFTLDDCVEALAYSQETLAYLGVRSADELNIEPLARGEYNSNFVLSAADKNLVLRVPLASQMHNRFQAAYEFMALDLLQESGRTPRPIACVLRSEKFPLGFLLEEYLEGRPLDYREDFAEAARILADIHSQKVRDEDLAMVVSPQNPYQFMLAECKDLLFSYLSWADKNPEVEKRVVQMVKLAHAAIDDYTKNPWSLRYSLINTELNSTNFLIGPDGHGSIVDWEKPLYAEPEQDLAHFMVPTTTLWRNDFEMDLEDMRHFCNLYWEAVDDRVEREGFEKRMALYLSLNCLRGVSWSCMAWAKHYTGERPIPRQDVLESIGTYLEPAFLDKLIERFFNPEELRAQLSA